MSAADLSWVVGALILLAPLFSRARRRWGHRVPKVIAEALVPVLLVAAVAWVYEPLFTGHPATTWDNNYGPLKAVEAEDLFRRHELFGWSDFENAGFPAHANYALAGAILEVALHRLPGSSLERAQAWSVWLSVVAIVLACYLAGRLHFGRTVGCLAGLLALLDPGDWWVGGHYSTVDIGMWIQTMSTAWVVLGLALWPIAVKTGRWGHLVLTGAVLGVAVLFHPQATLLLGASGVVMLLALLATPKPGPAAVLRRTTAIVAVTLSVCAFWLIQYLDRRSFGWFPNVEAVTSASVWDQFTKGSLLRGPALWVGAALVGGIELARRRAPFARFLSLVVLAFVVVFTVDALNLLHLRDPKEGGFVDGLQLPRVYFLVRPLCFVLAAEALGARLAKALRMFSGPSGGWASWATRALMAFLAWVLFQVPGVRVPGLTDNPRPMGGKGDDWVNVAPALDFAQTLMKPGERIVLHMENGNDHDLVFPAAERQLKILKVGTDAAMMFKGRFSTEVPELLERIGASVMIPKGKLPDPLKALPVAKTFGGFEVRTLPRLPRAWMEGPGQVAIESWKDEEIQLRVTGSRPGSKIRLGMSYYDMWRTTDDISTQPFEFHEATLSEVPAHDGEVVLRYHTPRVQWLGLMVTILGLALVAASRFWDLIRPRLLYGPPDLPTPQAWPTRPFNQPTEVLAGAGLPCDSGPPSGGG